LAVTAVLVAGSAVQAGLLAANSGGAIPAFTGTQFYNDGFSSFTVSANVDFAVFAPGAFGVAFPGQDPSGGTEYVYAYQIANLSTDINKMTVGLNGGDEPLGSIGSVAGVGLVDPSASLYVGSGTPNSAAWDFAPGQLGNGLSSAVLFFTSPAPPELDTATVNAAFADTHNLPSPTPEPATLTLLALGAGITCFGKRRRM